MKQHFETALLRPVTFRNVLNTKELTIFIKERTTPEVPITEGCSPLHCPVAFKPEVVCAEGYSATIELTSNQELKILITTGYGWLTP